MIERGKMGREFSRKLYRTKEWQKVRKLAFKRDNGVCQHCYRRYAKITKGEEVHHIIHLTPDNIIDLDIAYGLDNLITLCRSCHMEVHSRKKPTIEDGLIFDGEGNLISTPHTK